MLKGPFISPIIALVVAFGVNLYYFTTSTDLTVVVSRTLFADLFLVLTMVPIFEYIRLKTVPAMEPLVDRMKFGMKPVAFYTVVLAAITYFFYSLFGDVMVAERMSEIRELMDAAPEITKEQRAQQLEMAGQIYSSSTHVLIVILGSLFTGIFSSVLAAFVIKK